MDFFLPLCSPDFLFSFFSFLSLSFLLFLCLNQESFNMKALLGLWRVGELGVGRPEGGAC